MRASSARDVGAILGTLYNFLSLLHLEKKILFVGRLHVSYFSAFSRPGLFSTPLVISNFNQTINSIVEAAPNPKAIFVLFHEMFEDMDRKKAWLLKPGWF